MLSGSHRHRNWRRFIILACGVVLLLAIFLTIKAYYGRASIPVPYSGPVTHLTTALTEEYGSLVLIANQQGYFRDEGISMTIKNYTSGSPLMADLLAGKLDCGIASDFAGVLNMFHHEDIRILASAVQYQTFYLIARKDHGITNIPDIKGKRIGVTRVTAGEFFMGQFLTFNDLRPQDITLVNEPPAGLAADLESGKLDGAILFEPNAYPVLQQLGDKAIEWSVQDLQPGNGFLYCNGKLVRDNPAALARFVQALSKAQIYIQKHNAAARDYVAQYLHYSQAYIDYMWPKLTLQLTLKQELVINMNDEAQWAIENHLTTATQAPNYLDFVYFPPLDAIQPEAITIIH